MRCPCKRYAILTLFLITLALCEAANGCVCGGYPTTCEAFAGAESVFVGTVAAVEQVNPRKDEEGNAVSDGQLARVHVEQAFKNMKHTEVVFRSANSDCDAVYKEGQRWLFYAYYDRKGKAWTVRACDRSTLVENAADDLLYLQGLPESAQKTRLSVSLEHYEDEPEGGFSRVANLSGMRVKLVGAAKTYEAYTNGDGVAEVYGLPPGPYAVEPDVPKGLKVRFPIYYGEVKAGDDKTPRVMLREASCANVSFVFSADTSISGRLLGADGVPLPHVCLSLMPAGKVIRGNWVFDCTDAQGRYELKEMPPGQYVIVVNDEGKVSSDSPFRTAYYPGVFERERAGVITIIEGSNLKNMDIYIPAQEPTRVIRGVLLYSDGKPVADEFIEFKGDAVKDGYDGEAGTQTDARGRFSLTVLQGLKGTLRGSMNTFEGDYENCPQLDKIIRKLGGGVVEVKTGPVRVEVNADVQDVKLVFPFPACAKAKREFRR